jgi:hypothetical protein
MAAKSSVFDSDFLKLIFQATAIANLADNAGTAPATNLYVSLHTADPGTAGDQTTSEAAYTGYARVAVPRSSGGWTVTGNSVSPAADVLFAACTGGTATVTYFAVGTAASGAGKRLYSGPLTPTIAVSNGVQPKVLAASTITES